MKKITFVLFSLSFVYSQSLFGYISYFNRSLPNQAGVSYDYLLDQWDYATLPVFFSGAKSDLLTAFYSADIHANNGNFNLAGRNTLGGFPLYWGVNFNSTGTQTTKTDNQSTNTTSKTTNYNNNTTLQVGSLFAGFGVNVFAHLQDVGNSETETTTAGVTNTTKDYSNTQNAFGVNLGQGSEKFDFFWSVGLAYEQNGGDKETVNAGVKTKNMSGLLPDTNAIETTGFRLRTIGRLPLTPNALLAGWRAELSTASGSAEHISAGSKVADSKKNGFALDEIALYLTQVFPLGGESRFLINEEIGLSYGSTTTTLTGSGTFAGVKGEIKENITQLYLALPLIFQINISQNLLLNAGWYPSLFLVDSQSQTETTTAGGTTTTDKTTISNGIYGTGSRFGLGLSYLATKNLRAHFNVNPAGFAQAGNLSFGADYIF